MWDFDYTLAYRNGMWTQTIMDLIVEERISSIDESLISPITKKGFPWHNATFSHQELMNGLDWWTFLRMYFIKALIELDLPVEKATNIARRIKDKYLDINYWKAFDDTVEALDILSNKGYKHIILSNHVPELESLVKNLKLDVHFEEIISSGLVGYEKPHKMIFNYAISLLPENSDIIMVGDNYKADIIGAIENDIPAILVRKPNRFNYSNYAENLDVSFINKVEDIFGSGKND